MGLFPRKMNFEEGIEEWKDTPGAVLLDVRTAMEYKEGHIPGSVNVSSDRIQKVEEKIPDKDTPVYVYCLSGARARGAVSAMKKMGYSNAVNIGGIALYNGELEK